MGYTLGLDTYYGILSLEREVMGGGRLTTCFDVRSESAAHPNRWYLSLSKLVDWLNPRRFRRISITSSKLAPDDLSYELPLPLLSPSAFVSQIFLDTRRPLGPGSMPSHKLAFCFPGMSVVIPVQLLAHHWSPSGRVWRCAFAFGTVRLPRSPDLTPELLGATVLATVPVCRAQIISTTTGYKASSPQLSSTHCSPLSYYPRSS